MGPNALFILFFYPVRPDPILPRGSGRYVKGWYRDAGPPLYVSRGIGTTMLPFRLMARAEIPVFLIGF